MQKWKDHVNKCVQIHVQFIFDIYWTLKKVGTRTWRLIFPPSKRVKLNPFRHTTVHCNLTPIVLQDVNSHWLLSFWRPNEILKTNINFDATKGQNILKHYYWCGFFFFFNSSEEPCQMHVVYKNLWSPHGDEGGKRDQVMNMAPRSCSRRG